MKIIPQIVRRSCQYSIGIITVASTFAGLWGYTIRDLSDKLQWWTSGLILLCLFIIVSIVVWLILKKSEHCSYSTSINGKPIVIKVGNLFDELGWKVIPCNEYFDVQVDDKIVAHNTLHGKLIDEYVDDVNDLKNTIYSAEDDVKSGLKPQTVNQRQVYPLGRLIPYKDFLMLAFAHFDEHETAYIEFDEYEQLLFRMWSEMRNVYAAKPISLPLIGGGVTTIKGLQKKDYTSLLRCMLCTLKNSGFQADQGITIVLTQQVMDQIKMDEIREEY